MPAFERARLARGGDSRVCRSCSKSGFSARSRSSRAGRPADVGGSKRQALLAMLALRQGRVVEVDALVDGLWGEELPAAPRNALHHHIARLRAALGEESIVGSADGYALKGARVDAVRFEELLAETRAALRDGDAAAAADAVASALALWRGPALQGLTGTAWFSAEARRLEALRVDALEEQFEAALALGEHRELVPALRAALADNPFRERLWGQLMLALYRSGRQADALETFQEARRVLADELGLEPGPELRRLQEAILAHDPAIAAVPVVRRRRGNLPAPSTSFVGREEELAQVAGLLHEHRLVTLTGPPGVGKSRLAVEAARSLEHEFPDGIWLVDLARAGGAADAVRLLAHAVDVRGADPLARVTSRLRDAGALVVLDACEHVLDEAARIASTLLAGCPARAGAGDEPRGAPRRGRGAGPGRAARARRRVELFLERARAARPGFELDDGGRRARGRDRPARGRAAARDRARRRAGERARARGAPLDRRAARGAAARQPGLRPSPRRAARARGVELRPLARRREDAAPAARRAPRRRVARRRSSRSQRRTASTRRPSPICSPRWSTSRSSRSRSRGAARATTCSTRVREYVLERLAESGGLAAARGAHAEYFAALADEARDELRGPEWLRWKRRLELENDNFWAALAYARDAPDPAVAVRLGTLGWYFALAERVSEGRRFLELALAAAGDDAPVELRIELLAALCYLAAEELDLDAALAAGERALALAASARRRGSSGIAQMTLALALAQSGDQERPTPWRRGGRDARGGRRRLGRRGERPHPRDRSGARGGRRHRRRDGGDVRRHSDAIDYDAFRVPGMLLEAWVAERRGDGAAAEEAYRRALELAGAHRVRRPRRVRPRPARLERARGRRPARGRGAPAAGARDRRGGRRDAGSRPTRASSSRASPRRRRRGRRRTAVPRGARMVAAAAAAPGAREPLRRARRQPGDGRCSGSRRSPSSRRHARPTSSARARNSR